MRILKKASIKDHIQWEKVLEVVEESYKLKAQGKSSSWPLVEHHFEEFGAVTDIRSGQILDVHGAKMLNSFPKNKETGLPTFTGMLFVFDSTNGQALGILEASYITSMRTGAAAAIGAKYLARKDAKSLGILGTGRQSLFQLAAMIKAFPQLERVLMADPLDAKQAKDFAQSAPDRLKQEFSIETNINIKGAESVEEAVSSSDIVITITPARDFYVKKEWVQEGTHFSCIGADMKGKQELDPAILKDAKIYVDDLDQCVNVGEIEKAIATNVIHEKDIQGSIGERILNQVEGRQNPKDITVFDATGLAQLDLMVARYLIEEANKKDFGQNIDL